MGSWSVMAGGGAGVYSALSQVRARKATSIPSQSKEETQNRSAERLRVGRIAQWAAYTS